VFFYEEQIPPNECTSCRIGFGTGACGGCTVMNSWINRDDPQPETVKKGSKQPDPIREVKPFFRWVNPKVRGWD